SSSLVAIVACAFAGPLSELVLGHRDTTIMLITIGGLWVFSNIELANAQLRVDERAATYLKASFANVGLTIVLTVWLVVVEHGGCTRSWRPTTSCSPAWSWPPRPCSGGGC